MSKEQEYFKTNAALWDAKTRIHLKSDFYDQEAFMAGKTSLKKIELAGFPDLKGKTLLHSQCHFGQDTLSLQKMGAQCTGIDISQVAIDTARELNKQLDLEARFVQSNVYNLDQHLTEQYDVVFTSYGVIGWLPDLDRWAEQLMKRLKPGGVFYMVEFHPCMYQFDWDTKQIAYRYFNNGDPYVEEEEGTYADKSADIKLKEYFWQHSFEEVLMPLMNKGLRLTKFREYDYSPYDLFTDSVLRAQQEYIFQVNGTNIPLVFEIQGTKN